MKIWELSQFLKSVEVLHHFQQANDLYSYKKCMFLYFHFSFFLLFGNGRVFCRKFLRHQRVLNISVFCIYFVIWIISRILIFGLNFEQKTTFFLKLLPISYPSVSDVSIMTELESLFHMNHKINPELNWTDFLFRFKYY